jgi:co-chaperonin GroES (HSP10)
MTPIRNKVLVKHISPDELKTDSGIIIPLKSGLEDDNRQIKAEVMAVADTIKDIKVGDIVQVYKWAGSDYSHREYQGCKVLEYKEIIGVWDAA